MEKQKRWQLFVIIGVLLLTLYNILPTVIFYSKPLSQPLTQKQAIETAEQIATRVNQLEEDAVAWVKALCKNINLEPQSITIDPKDPQVVITVFKKPEDARFFRGVLPRAGAMVPFGPSQLSLFESRDDSHVEGSTTVHVLRHLGVHLNTDDLKSVFQFHQKQENGLITPEYAALVMPRFAEIVDATCGDSYLSSAVSQAIQSKNADAIQFLAEEIIRTDDIFEAGSQIRQRTFKSLSQSQEIQKEAGNLAQKLIALFSDRLRSLDSEIKAISSKGDDATDLQKSELAQLLVAKTMLHRAEAIVQKEESVINSNIKPWTFASALAWASKQRSQNPSSTALWNLVVGDRDPFISEVVLDWGNDVISLRLHPEVLSIMQSQSKNEVEARKKEETSRRLSLEVARICRLSGEDIKNDGVSFRVSLSKLSGSTSFITLDLQAIGTTMAQQVAHQISNDWNTQSPDLSKDTLKIFDSKGYQNASIEERRLSLVVFVPDAQFASQNGMKTTSLYVVGKGFKQLLDGKEERAIKDIQNLAEMLQARGFVAYLGDTLTVTDNFNGDVIFELDGYASPLLQATREQFVTYSGVPYAILECTDYEQRLLSQNRIDNAIQEDLVRWKEAWQSAQVDVTPGAKFYVPKPTSSAFISNIKRAARLYVRGDDSKVLRWGLDLSGGKTVKLGLVDQNGRQVTKTAELQQAASELYTRLNKMGVSERIVRIENDNISIDFPGVQGVSAQELLQASAMFFHMENEQFGPRNQALAKDVNDFLQEVWSEAVVSSRKDIESINEIAYQKLERARSQKGASLVGNAASRLIDQGLILKNPQNEISTVDFDDRISQVARYRGDDPAEWHGLTHPLLFVFKNFALEGSSLDNVHASYDTIKGNILVFNVKSSSTTGRAESPRDEFYQWTSQFAEDKIIGTAREAYTQGQGWRMAVILNGEVISDPSLSTPLRDGGMISGSFSQSEVHRLATDLRAGSLSFTPKILLEQNVSPELGKSERIAGISASLLGVIAVVALMVTYYHFAGVVASIAVIFNIIIVWAVMQNIGAAITLPVLAGLVLTVGMAVDANVLVFERIREEYLLTKRIASAISIGYKKAFSAIVDSNVTTILAALILIQFDSGPIKGFALALIIGIISSMFTSLFVTKYYFAGWVQNPANTELKMSKWIPDTSFDFLKFKKLALVITVVIAALGIASTAISWRSLLGMDFTGGYCLTVEVEPSKDSVSPRVAAQNALLASGLDAREFQVRELGRPDLLRFQLSLSLEQPGQPFYQMPEALNGTFAYEYQSNPRIDWLVSALEGHDVKIRPSSKPELLQYWTTMSGQFSSAMRNNAIIALTLSLIGVLVYIAVRFEWSYAVSSVAALAHNLLMTLSIMAIANIIGAPLQLNLEVVGALMTIIGYSLNDTIIVFDRVREDAQLFRKKRFADIVNFALNKTLSRTAMTSGTTLAVLICLVLFGGSSIFAFSFVMLTGVFVGTLSTMFIASPLLVALHEKGED